MYQAVRPLSRQINIFLQKDNRIALLARLGNAVAWGREGVEAKATVVGVIVSVVVVGAVAVVEVAGVTFWFVGRKYDAIAVLLSGCQAHLFTFI